MRQMSFNRPPVVQWHNVFPGGTPMTDLTYELQRMTSRTSEIETAVKRHGPQIAWDQYSRTHGIDERRFKKNLDELRSEFDRIGSRRR
jgi:hypothetical protein